jgi:hypothetical protein
MDSRIGFLLAPGLLQGFFVPRLPSYRIVGVLAQVRAGFT